MNNNIYLYSQFLNKNLMKMKLLILSVIIITLSSCKQTANEAAVVDDSKQSTIDSIKVVMAKKDAEIAKQKSIDSMQTVMANQHSKQLTTVHNSSAPAIQKKKGWSRAAKGAVIGAGVGAVTGALIDKKHGEGAVIGGIAGAGLGAGTGAILDSKKNK